LPLDIFRSFSNLQIRSQICAVFGGQVTVARIGGGAYFPHTHGIVIGHESVIGEDVTIYQGVTIGRVDSKDPKVPTIGDRATIYAGAKIIGAISIGRESIVGANAVVLNDVPAKFLAIGVPARMKPRSGPELADISSG
jgi:serine O-acetyltransferase